MISNSMKALQSMQKDFEDQVIFNPKYADLHIQSVFIDLKNNERRAVVIVGKGGAIQKVTQLAQSYFKSQLRKIISYEEDPVSTAILNSGKGVRHSSTPGWGTLGGFFKVKNSTRSYGLSNNHVISNFDQANIGDPIRYSSDNLVAGKLFRRIPLNPFPQKNYIDAALFQVNNNHNGHWTPTPPKHPWIGPKPHLKVYKNGFATEITKGIITGYNGTARVLVNGIPLRFSGIMAIRSPQGHFNKEGDSGSIVFSLAGNHMVGLVFAKQGLYCWALPISRIKSLLL